MQFIHLNPIDVRDKAMIRLLTSHGMMADAVRYAEITKNSQRHLVMHYFSKLKYEKALEIVCTESADKKLFGQYASIFLDKVPEQTLQALT